MKTLLTTTVAVVAAATAAQSGGLDRSGQPIGWLFESGTYAELSFGSISPTVSGSITPPGIGSGNVTPDYTVVSLAFKTDLNDRLSLGIQLDPTYGADVAYPLAGSSYPIRGANAVVDGDSLVLAARYKFGNGFSAHAGLRRVGIGGNVTLWNAGAPFYQASFARDYDVGYLAGVAYERPEIALRVALTYSSATTHDLATTVGGAPAPTQTVEMPQSLALDFQSGVAKDTLVFGQIRWSEWTKTELNGPGLPVTLNPLVSYSDDVVSYTLGVGRRFNEKWSGAVSVSYEERTGEIASNLSPTDGSLSLGLGATYTHENVKITGGVRYVKIGDTRALGGASAFEDNSALAVGFKIGITF